MLAILPVVVNRLFPDAWEEEGGLGPGWVSCEGSNLLGTGWKYERCSAEG
jgi:hypothetical protein